MKRSDSQTADMVLRAKMKRMNDWWFTITLVCSGVKKLYDWGRSKITYSISVMGNDWLYDEVHRWVLETVERQEVKSLIVKTSYVDDGLALLGSSGSTHSEHEIMMYADDTSRHTVRIDGQNVDVYVFHPDLSSIKFEKLRDLQAQERVTFQTLSLKGQTAIQDLLSDLVARKERRDKIPMLKMAAQWGGWQDRKDLPPRQLESVVLRAGQLEEIVADLTNFLAQEGHYVTRSIPWHRGFLLEGPPGTGKTSLPRALAHHFGMDCYAVSLGDVTKDTDLLGLIGAIPARNILVLEDVDVFRAATERSEGDGSGTTLSGLLNSLDGLGTPHGLVTFLTTNVPDALDAALLRKGRIDKRYFLDYVDQDQANRLFEHFYGRKPSRIFRLPPGQDLSPADVIELFKQYMDDAKGAEKGYTHLQVAA